MRQFANLSFRRYPPSPGLDILDLKRYSYIDKTRLLARILSDDPKYSPGKYLHAPAMRRIGKSMVIRFLAALAEGGEDTRMLFDGMDVNEPDSPFSIGMYPLSVIQIDFSGSVHLSMPVSQVEGAVSRNLCRAAHNQHKICIPLMLEHPGEVLAVWVEKLFDKERKPIVLLIDEYDAPVNSYLPEYPEKAHEVALILKPFYETIKSHGEYFHKVFVTGVSKFSATSMFSGPNQFYSLMEETAEFSTLFGFTEAEIRRTYGSFIEMKFNAPLDQILSDMKLMYNGYKVHPFQKNCDLLYNPWSVLSYIHSCSLKGYWAKSAQSASVMSMLGLRAMNILNGFEITQDRLFASISAKEYNTCWEQMAFQSGYASILSSHSANEFYDSGKTQLQLGPPNEEVTRFLKSGMIHYVANTSNSALLADYRRNLFGFNFQKARKYLRDLIARQSRLPSNEAEFAAFAVYSLQAHDTIPSVLDILFERGVKLNGEVTSAGKYPTFDCAILYRYEKSIRLLVIELKFNYSKGSGAKQIIEKKYIQRARKILEERNNVTIDIERGVSLNLLISPSKRVNIEIEHFSLDEIL